MRVQFKSTQQAARNGKWSVTFETLKGLGKDEWVAYETESAAVFDTDTEALAGAGRALNIVRTTGAFPNMCIPF